MNILFVTCWYPIPSDSRFGIFVHEQAKAVAEAGANVKVLHVWPVKGSALFDKHYSVFEKEGIEVHQLLIESYVNGFFYNFWPALQQQAERLLREKIVIDFRPDLLHGNVVYPAGFITRFLAGLLTVPYLLSEHWSKLHWVFGRPFYRNRARRVYSDASSIHPVSEELKEQIRHYAGDLDQLQVIPNVVDTGLFNYRENGRGRTPVNGGESGTMELLCVTNFLEKKELNKRPDLLLNAYFSLEEDLRKRMRIRFVGPGEKIGQYRREVDRRGLASRIMFEGPREKSVIAGRMKQADFLLHPTEKETFGVVVAEALCSGLPAIVSDLPVLRNKIDDGNGVVVPANTVECWAGILRNIASGEYHFDRKQIATATGDRFSYGRIGGEFLDAYRRALSGA